MERSMLSKLLTKQSAKAKNIMLRQRQVVFELMTLFRKCIFKKNVQKNKDKFYFFHGKNWKKINPIQFTRILQVRVMRKLCHPRIVSLIEDQDSPEWLFLVMELVSGNYKDYSTNNNSLIPLTFTFVILRYTRPMFKT